MAERKIRAVFFDVDDTLFATSEFARQAHLSAVRAMVQAGVRMSCEELFDELKEVVQEFTSNYPYHFDKLLLRLPPETHCHVNRAIVIASAVIAYHDTVQALLAPYPDALSILKALAGRDVVRGVITAGLSIKQAEKLVRLGVYPYLSPDAIFISEQIGISKPNPKIYKWVCKALSLSPEEVVYVGDNPTRDIDPPNHIGMVTVRIRKGGKYDEAEGKTAPRYEIRSFDELVPLLERDFLLP